MSRRTDFLHRPPFGWRLTILPLIVIPWAVYLASPVVQHSTDPHTASVVAGGAPINAAPREVTPATTEVQSRMKVGEASVAAPVHGIDGKGRHYLIERSPKYPMIEFSMRLKQPET